MKKFDLLSLHHCMVACAVLAALALPAMAQDANPSHALRIGSGPTGKVYELIVKDIQAVCGAEVPVESVASIGGIPNLMMLSASQVELGIVQLDTLRAVARDGDENIKALQAIMPLHMNLLHVLTLKDGSRTGMNKIPIIGSARVIRKFSDLKDASIAVVGSTQLLGQTLNNDLHYGMKLFVAESDDQAIKMLRDNQVQAIFTDGGWPLPSITRHEQASGLALVEYDLPVQAPFAVVKRSYPNLGALNYAFLGSPNLLVARPFRVTGEIGKRVAALQSCLLRNLEELKEGRYHAAWKDIKNPTDTLGVMRFGKAEKVSAALR
jgi:TRAP-type uncharacterized transport system substrate-binding protein